MSSVQASAAIRPSAATAGRCYAGRASGGAIADFGTASLYSCTFYSNQAKGGNNSTSGTGLADTNVDDAVGGAIDTAEVSDLSVSGGLFNKNEAIGGNNGNATGTGIVSVGNGLGGGICSHTGCTVDISGITMYDNQAIGGNGNSGSGSVVGVGTAVGGAIDSVIGNLKYPETLTVTDSKLTQNDATGGSNNSGTSSVFDLVGALLVGALRTAWAARPTSATMSWRTTTPRVAIITRPMEPGSTPPASGPGAPSVITLATTTPVLSAD